MLVLAVFLVLGLLLVAATGKVRELANRVECQHRLKRIGLALMQHHDQRGIFPSVGGYRDEEAYLVVNRGNCHPGTQKLGLGSPFASPEEQSGSWLYQLLPYLDDSAARQLTADQPTGVNLGIKELMCPSRGRPAIIETTATDPLFPRVSYSSVPAGLMTWGRTDYAANGLILPGRGDPLIRFSNVRPGLAHAVLVGEKALDTRAYMTGGWIEDAPAFAGGPTCVRKGIQLQRDGIDPNLAFQSPAVTGWGSPHASGTHFLFAAGQVRLVRHNLSEELLRRLLGPSNSLPNLD
jgi:hypothetical protein